MILVKAEAEIVDDCEDFELALRRGLPAIIILLVLPYFLHRPQELRHGLFLRLETGTGDLSEFLQF